MNDRADTNTAAEKGGGISGIIGQLSALIVFALVMILRSALTMRSEMA